MRRTISLILAVAAASSPASAQGLSALSFRVAPQYTSYKLDQAGLKVKINELAVPIAFVVPLTSRISFDIASAFATATVESTGDKSTISGLTDTQLRLNLTLGSDAIVFTAGINVPSGQYEVAEDKIAAAGRIGNDFLAFPVSSFGSGLAGTGGVAIARALGSWNLGVGASFRKSAEFGAFQTDADALRFTPADEMRFRLGLDHAAGDGRMMFGVVYSKFGQDATDDGIAQSTYSTGDRIIGQAAFDVPIGEKQFYLGGWFLHHAEGEQVGGAAPSENIVNVIAALGLNVGSLFLEPSVEGRLWQVAGDKAGTLMYGGLRTRFHAGSAEISPSIAYGIGTIEGATKTDVTGLKGGVTIRLTR